MFSTALGGQAVSELNQYGAKKRSYVYSGGQVVAKQEGNAVLWDNRDSTGRSTRMVNSSATVTSRVELDPLSIAVDPTNVPQGNSTYSISPVGFYGTPQDTDLGCVIDRIPAPCGMARAVVRSGAGFLCPPGGCPTAGWNPNRDGPGQGGFFLYRYTDEGVMMDAIGGSRKSQDTGGGGGTGQGPGALNTGPTAEFKYGKFLNCLKKYFPDLKTFDDGRSRSFSFDRSTGGSFVGSKNGNLILTSTATNRYDSTYLGYLLQQIRIGDGKPNSGGTFAITPQYNFVAKDVANNSQYTDVGVFGVFIHELANSIGEQYGLADTFGGYRAQNARRGINDADVGAAFESCVFGGLVGLQTGRVGSHRELR